MRGEERRHRGRCRTGGAPSLLLLSCLRGVVGLSFATGRSYDVVCVVSVGVVNCCTGLSQVTTSDELRSTEEGISSWDNVGCGVALGAGYVNRGCWSRR